MHQGKLFITLVGLCVFFYIATKVDFRKSQPSVHVVCETTQGPLGIDVHPDWSPKGAQRFLQLVDEGFYSDLPLFRCMSGFLCQFGAKPNNAAKKYSPIPDDPQRASNRNFKEGYLSFAGFGVNTRTTHVFIALAAVPSLGTQPWETPFAMVDAESIFTVRKFYTGYGDSKPTGQGPEARLIESENGAEYLKKGFPQLDYFTSCTRK